MLMQRIQKSLVAFFVCLGIVAEAQSQVDAFMATNK